MPVHPVTSRHVATAAAAIALLAASRLPPTRRGIGSATATTDLIDFGSGIGDGTLHVVGIALVVVLALGLVLGVTVVVPGRLARGVWAGASVVVVITAVGALLALRSRSGPAVFALLLAAVALVAGWWLDTGRTGSPDPG